MEYLDRILYWAIRFPIYKTFCAIDICTIYFIAYIVVIILVAIRLHSHCIINMLYNSTWLH